MNSSAYVCTLEFIFTKSAQASRISKIGLPVAFYSYKLNFKNIARSGQFVDSLKNGVAKATPFFLSICEIFLIMSKQVLYRHIRQAL